MKISFNWLKEFIDIQESPETVAELLTHSGLEVEKIEKFESLKGGLEGVVIGEVLTCEQHPNADRLKKTTVDVGLDAPINVVCGAPNVAAGQKVAVATIGATLYTAEGEAFPIKKSKIRGEVSEGMICAEDELGLGQSHDGIMVLKTDLKPGTPAADYFDVYKDVIFEIGLTPNRADAASHFGVSRDLKALLKRSLKKAHEEITLPEKKSDQGQTHIAIEEQSGCVRYAGISITGITVKDSPEWLKNKLRAIGLAPINNVVDVTNYILHGLGQPLHAFDLEEVKGKKVLIKTVAEGTPFVTLDGVERKLKATDLMICNEEAPMCIAGVFGGADSGVTSETTSVFIESACFSPDYVRKTSMVHGLKTDASFRFERGTDPRMVVDALKKAASLILEVAGGQIASDLTDLYPSPVADADVKTSYSRICDLIGVDIPASEIKEILANLDIDIQKEEDGKLSLKVPPYRVDVKREADIIEEVIRIYGFDKVEAVDRLSAAYIADFPEKDKEKLYAGLSTILTGNGFNEIVTNSLTKPAYAEWLKEAETSVSILNKLSEDLGVMRQRLLFSGLEVIAWNINRRQKDLKLFELGKIYQKDGESYKEHNRLALFLTGNKTHESWTAPKGSIDYYGLKQIVDMLLSKAGLENLSSGTPQQGIFSEGVSFYLKDKEVVSLGKVSNDLLKKMDISQPVYYADIDFDGLLNYSGKDLVYQEISRFPEVRRDLSLVLDTTVTFEQIETLAKKIERKLLTNVNVFDVYEGENLGEGKKSYSVSFILQDLEKTLTDKVIDKTMNRLMTAFEKELGAVIRK
ncbi:phenylalanine--tRNA ligase subunit beta [Cytophagaceae bacterium ABcell3]|nr:phenylalanine--tRNA ligase subunit beta [Cytophagaceae bacterium ABcell3]